MFMVNLILIIFLNILFKNLLLIFMHF